MFVILIVVFNSIYSSFIILPFEKENNKNNFLQSKYNINIYSIVEIGEPKQKIKIYYRDELFSFFVLNKDITYEEEKTNFPYECNLKEMKYFNNLYDKEESSTYKNISDNKNFFIDIYYRKGFLSSETFYFTENTQNDLKQYNDVEFVLVNKIKQNRTLISGAIGLLVDEYFLEGAQNFAKMLVKKNITKFYIWSKIYFNNDNGIFVFGDFPHVLYNDKFSKEQYIETDIKLNVYKQKWNLNFNEIFIKIKKDDSESDILYNDGKYKYFYLNITLYGELKHNLGLIIGTVEYQNLIEDIFFNKNIEKDICHKNKILINDFNDDKMNYTYYFCNNDESFNKKNFPALYLKQYELKYTFELNENDLFILFNDKWYFMIIFEGEETRDQRHKWMFGEPLLKKYQFVFDPANYKIGFYNPIIPRLKQESKENEGGENDKIIDFSYKRICYFVILILFVIIFLLLLYQQVIKKNFGGKRKNNGSYTELQNLIYKKI